MDSIGLTASSLPFQIKSPLVQLLQPGSGKKEGKNKGENSNQELLSVKHSSYQTITVSVTMIGFASSAHEKPPSFVFMRSKIIVVNLNDENFTHPLQKPVQTFLAEKEALGRQGRLRPDKNSGDS